MADGEQQPKLSAVPTSVQQLKKLLSLDLNGNQLTDLPEWIGDLKELGRLNVSDNPFTVDGMISLLELILVVEPGSTVGNLNFLHKRCSENPITCVWNTIKFGSHYLIT